MAKNQFYQTVKVEFVKRGRAARVAIFFASFVQICKFHLNFLNLRKEIEERCCVTTSKIILAKGSNGPNMELKGGSARKQKQTRPHNIFK